MQYFISDTHFFHENIIRICNRPFLDLERMHAVLGSNWNKKVKPEDEVYILGDLSYKCPDGGYQQLFKLIKNLNGNKHLIIGNHDSKWLKSYNNQCNEKLFESISIYKDIYDDKNRRIIMFHYPIEDWDGMYRGSYHLYGHVHNVDNGYKVIPNRFNVGVDVIDFEPKTLDELIEINK